MMVGNSRVFSNARPMAIALLAAGLMTSGCTGSLLETKFPVPTTYVLAPVQANDANSDGSAGAKISSTVDLAVGIPMSSPGLDTERIATLHDERRLDYYQDARWGATAASVVQSLLVSSLQNQRTYRSVTPEQARVSATHLLDLQLHEFHAVYADGRAAPTVKVAVTATLLRLKDRKLLASFPIAANVPAAENRLSAVVAAFESATQQAILALNRQAAAALASDAP